jgi:hypothetical protein
MDAALAGAIGAGVGALATVAGSLLTTHRQADQQRVAAARRRKEEAYDNTIRFLLRARNRRSLVTAEGLLIIAQADIGTFFDDLIEAQTSLSVLLTACGSPQRPAIEAATSRLNDALERLSTDTPNLQGVGSVLDLLCGLYDDVIAAAREDIGVGADSM